ncbi:reverse transcriptase [Thalictrum thalictroides]|uniref:ribonuclease H n=1 Tax=Thalictrum thalictroides TaxID=46969 RepID=A0A7J6VXM2_THATH|nr:reverse transcriptase [Thalictrum thalictroides]
MRTRKLDPYHPLYKRSHDRTTNPALSRLSRFLKKIPSSEKINPLLFPPWERGTTFNYSFDKDNLDFFDPSDSSGNKFQTFLNRVPKNDIQLYTDGSKNPEGGVGIGYVIYQIDRQVFRGSGPLCVHNVPYDAEVHAVLHGIRTATNLPTARFAKDLWVFTDNKELASKFYSMDNIRSSQKAHIEALEAAKMWKSRLRLPHIDVGQVKICWIPGHSGITGNEQADYEAKKGSFLSYHEDNPSHSFSSLEKWHSLKLLRTKEVWWKTHLHTNYTQLEINTIPAFPKELLLSRKALGRIISLRTGHGDFAAYHKRFGHTNSNENCLCGSSKTRLHLFFCRILRRRGYRPKGSINQLLPKLLGTPEGAILLTKWLEQTKFFEEICTR